MFSPRIVSLLILITLIVFLGITFYQVIAPFVFPLFLAAVIAALCQPLLRYCVAKCRGRVRLGAALATLAILAIFLVPVTVGTFIGSVQMYVLATEKLGDEAWLNKFNERAAGWIDRFVPFVNRFQPAGAEPLTAEKIAANFEVWVRTLFQDIGNRSLSLVGGSVGNLLGLAAAVTLKLMIFVVALYYFFADGPALLAGTEQLIPLHAEYQRRLLNQFAITIRAVVLGTVLAAVAQGLTTAIPLYFFGFEHFWVLFFVVTILSLVPMLGAWLVWLPCAILLFTDKHPIQAIFLIAWGAGVVGLLDNVIRTYVLNSDTKLHPLLALVSVLGGLQFLGLWGVFIGPVVASCLHALVEIFNQELTQLTRDRQQPTPETPPPSSRSPSSLPDSRANNSTVATAPDSPPEASNVKSSKT